MRALQQAVLTLRASAATRGLLERLYATRRAALVDALAGHGIGAQGQSGLRVWMGRQPIGRHIM